jgi:Uncharacterized protein conserved in bacteria (DUF2188)
MASNFWVVKSSSGWVVKKEGSSRPTSVHSTQTQAWAESRRLARGVGGDAFLKGHDGRIRAQNSYKDAPSAKRG